MRFRAEVYDHYGFFLIILGVIVFSFLGAKPSRSSSYLYLARSARAIGNGIGGLFVAWFILVISSFVIGCVLVHLLTRARAIIWGSTYGKRILNLQIRQKDGNQISWKQGIGRYLIKNFHWFFVILGTFEFGWNYTGSSLYSAIPTNALFFTGLWLVVLVGSASTILGKDKMAIYDHFMNTAVYHIPEESNSEDSSAN